MKSSRTGWRPRPISATSRLPMLSGSSAVRTRAFPLEPASPRRLNRCWLGRCAGEGGRCRLTPPAFGPFLGLVQRDGFGRLAGARAAPDRSLHFFQGAEPELTVRRLAGPAVRDVMTAIISPKSIRKSASSAHGQNIGGPTPAGNMRSSDDPQSRRAAPPRVTGPQPAKMGRLTESSWKLTTRAPVYPLAAI